MESMDPEQQEQLEHGVLATTSDDSPTIEEGQSGPMPTLMDVEEVETGLMQSPLYPEFDPPALPAVDYHQRRTVTPTDNWAAELEPGLEVEAETVFNWPIPDWEGIVEAGCTSSPSFQLGQFTWYVMLLPKGTPEVKGRAVSIFLKAQPIGLPDGQEWHVCARLQLSMTSPQDTSAAVRKHTQHRYEASEPDWGFTQFVTPRCLTRGDSSTGNLPLVTYNAVNVQVKLQIIKDPTGMLWHNFINYDSKKATGFVGLLNQGATCYMNSLLQSLYQTNMLRRATYRIPTEGYKPTESIALALQRTFYRLQTSPIPVGTTELTRSFGWDTMDAFMQHDVHEFNRVLLDELESKMKKTESEGMVEKIFTGRVKNVRKCLNVPFESNREEDFYDIQLTIRGMRSLEESFDAYIKPEFLTGDNKYHTEEFGYQDAKMFCVFERLPPVLHLHLERYTFDPMTGNTIKINDRFEFGERINLDRYLSETADKSVPQDYRLHSVLVHGGDSHGGHYFAFVKHGDRWFKFDDTKVLQVTDREAVEENFGYDPADDSHNMAIDGEAPIVRMPSFTRMQRVKRMTNAYMLVYVREADWEEIMSPVRDEDIPHNIGEGVRADAEAEERRRAEKYEAMNALHVSLFTDRHLAEFSGPDVYNLTNRAMPMANFESIRAKRTDTIGEFKEAIAEGMGIPIESMRLWTFATRRNHTSRVDVPLEDDEKTLGYLSQGSRSSLSLFLEVNESMPPFDDEKQALVLVKHFDRDTLQLRQLGHFIVQRDEPVSRIMALIQCDEDCEIWEEVKATRVDPVNPAMSFTGSRIATGDIIIVQRKAGEQEQDALPFIQEYYNELVQNVVVLFRPLEESASRKRSSEDLPTEDGREFNMLYSLDSGFAELANMAAKRYDHPAEQLRFHIMDPKTEKWWPMKSLDRPDLTLGQALITSSPISLPKEGPVNCEFAFAVELLDMPLVDLEAMKPLRLHITESLASDLPAFVEVYVPFDATLADLLKRVPAPISLALEGVDVATLRLFEVQHSKILRDFTADDLLSSIPDYADVYLSVDQTVDPAAKLINVQYYWRDPSRAHSLPFIFPLLPNEPWALTKQRLLACAKRGDDNPPVSLIAFGMARPIGDEEVLYTRVGCLPASNRIAGTDSLGIDTPPEPVSSPRMASAASPAERSIKIRSSTPQAKQ